MSGKQNKLKKYSLYKENNVLLENNIVCAGDNQNMEKYMYVCVYMKKIGFKPIFQYWSSALFFQQWQNIKRIYNWLIFSIN